MAELLKFNKTSEETLDYNIDFSDFLTGANDTIDTFEISSDAGITITNTSESQGIISLWVSGGETSQRYYIEVKINTLAGRVKLYTFILAITTYPEV